MRCQRHTIRPIVLMAGWLLTGWVCACLLTAAAGAGEGAAPRRMTLADILPPQTLVYVQRPDQQSEDARWAKTALGRMAANPDIAAFRNDWRLARQALVKQLATNAKLSPVFVGTLYSGRLSLALLDVRLADSGNADFSFAATLQLARPLAPEKVFEAIRVAFAGFSPETEVDGRKIKIKQITVREAPIGNHPVMMVLHQRSPLRFVVLGDMILIYSAAKRDRLKVIVHNYDNQLTAKSLSRYPLYRWVYRGTECRPGMSFLYTNMNRLYAILGGLRSPRQNRLLNVLGLPSAQAFGMAGGAYREGMRHTLYLYAPGARKGLLDTLSLATKAENAAAAIPAQASGVLAARVDLARLYYQLPVLADAVERVFQQKSSPSLARLAGAQTILGVPARELLATLGDAIILQPGPAGNVLRFDAANTAALKQTLARMRLNGKPVRFTALPVRSADGRTHTIHYFNRSGLPIPLAPAYCITQLNGAGKRPTLILATHPQAIKAILRQPSRGTLHNTPDYQRVAQGMGKGHGVFIYLRDAENHVRVYDRLLPVLNAWTALPWVLADPGKLPPGNELKPYLFGCGVGIKNASHGITFTAYGPLGVGDFIVFLADEFSGTLSIAALELIRAFDLTAGASAAPTNPTTPGRPPSIQNGIPGIGD